MGRRSAGVLLYRKAAGGTEILLVHPGGPFWARRDTGAWSIPKGEAETPRTCVRPRRAVRGGAGRRVARRPAPLARGGPASPWGNADISSRGDKHLNRWR